MPSTTCLLPLAAVPLLAIAAPAQTPLAEAVEQCLAATAEDEHRRLLEQLLARPDATADALLAVLTAAPPAPVGPIELRVPFADEDLVVNVQVPRTRPASGLLPVLMAINWSSPPLDDAVREHVITADVSGHKPPQFSDAGRDAHSKVLRTIAYRAGGDPDALWFTGFSWGGHACWDNTLHRPGVVRGFIARGGGPRRTMFRLLPNLAEVRTLAVCGAKDDPELVWNLREVQRTAKGLGLQFDYWEAPDNGHDQPLPGEAEAGAAMLATAALERQTSGTILADGARVEHPLLLIEAVDERRCEVPAQIAVSANLSPDEQRRATIRKMDKAVASVRWAITEKQGTKIITLTGKGVRSGQLFLREPWFSPGEPFRVVVGRKTIATAQVTPDARTLLEEVRRTGDRQRPILSRIAVKF